MIVVGTLDGNYQIIGAMTRQYNSWYKMIKLDLINICMELLSTHDDFRRVTGAQLFTLLLSTNSFMTF